MVLVKWGCGYLDFFVLFFQSSYIVWFGFLRKRESGAERESVFWDLHFLFSFWPLCCWTSGVLWRERQRESPGCEVNTKQGEIVKQIE